MVGICVLMFYCVLNNNTFESPSETDVLKKLIKKWNFELISSVWVEAFGRKLCQKFEELFKNLKNYSKFAWRLAQLTEKWQCALFIKI